MRSVALKINAYRSSVTAPGIVAGLIFVVVALTTGASTVTSVTGGIVLSAMVVTVGLLIRTVYEHKAVGVHR